MGEIVKREKHEAGGTVNKNLNITGRMFLKKKIFWKNFFFKYWARNENEGKQLTIGLTEIGN